MKSKWFVACALLLLTSISWAAIIWSEPVLLTELNNSTTGWNAAFPHLSRDGSTLYFGRRDASGVRQLYTAARDSETGAFSNISQISELAVGDHSLYTPWLSDDGLRLYYGEYIGGETGLRLNMATRPDMASPWSRSIIFTDIHTMGDVDIYPSLTSDELTMYYASDKNNIYNEQQLWMATRSSLNEQFSNPMKITELDTGNIAKSPCILQDGLVIYYAQEINGKYDLYQAERDSINDPFTNIQGLNLNTVLGNEMYPYVTPDQAEIFFTTDQGIMYAYQIPEPTTVALLALGTLLLRRKR